MEPSGPAQACTGIALLFLTVALDGDEESASDSIAIEYEVNWCSELILKWRQIEESVIAKLHPSCPVCIQQLIVPCSSICDC